MPASAPGVRHAVPWELRIGASLPASPLVAGCGVAAVCFGVFVVGEWLAGIPLLVRGGPSPVPLSPPAYAALVMAVLVGYGLIGTRVLFDPAPGAPPLRVTREGLRASRWGGASVLLIEAALLVGLFRWAPVGDPHPISRFGNLLIISLSLLLAWGIGRVAFFTGWGSLRAAEQLRGRDEIDILDLGDLKAFGRLGLRLSLIWIVGVSLAIFLLILDPSPRFRGFYVGLFAAGAVGAVLALLIPVLGVQRKVREAKRVELSRLDAEVRAIRAGGQAEPGRLADLLAMRAFVSGVREWPFDSPTLARFVLYLLIPMASWVGGAMVERGIGALLE